MKGIGATRGTGSSGGIIGASPTGVEFGLDVGIGKLGISTDYGGGIVVVIFGQKIVWGREGGKIHYNFGGLEVIVEARNCVVTETRRIWGQVVGRHVYPDPGCKLPPEPKPEPKPKPETPLPPPGIPIPRPSSPDLSCSKIFSTWKYRGPLRRDVDNPDPIAGITKLYPDNREGSREESIRQIYPLLYGKLSDSEMAQLFGIPTENLTSVFVEQLRPVRYYILRNSYGGTSFVEVFDESAVNASDMRILSGWHNIVEKDYTYNIVLHKVDAIEINYAREIIGQSNTGALIWSSWALAGTWRYSLKCGDAISLSPPAGNQPIMTDKCCQALKADIAEIKKVLATKEILAGKMTFPWRWRMPGGAGEEKIMDYPNLARAIAQMIDHLGIHPPKLSIKDINNAIAGDQSLSNQFPSATQGFEALMAQVWDANADVDTLTNFLYRLSWLCVQQSMNLARLSGDIQTLKDMLGGETEPEETSITTPFNIGAGIKEQSTRGQGFGKNAGKIDGKIDINTEVATESLLPDFLKIRENPIVVEKFSGDKDVFDLLTIIILKLESLQRT
ncbi:hypothetical protein [Microcoleus sp. B7-D4]|uniref:hypothetical protein n=1 Tax=Microcoleus sp. B7-D4 TaxID=2818696 RepID=UPI002FCF048C